MSWSDTILSNTLGLAYRAASGNVDHWTLQQQKDDVAAATAQAMGPDADPAAVAIETAKTQQLMDSYLRSIDAHPDQAGIRLPGLGVVGTPEFLKKLEHLVYGILAVAAVGTAGYFALKYKHTLKTLLT